MTDEQMRVKIAEGHRFVRLTAVKSLGKLKKRGEVWAFRCDCGAAKAAFVGDVIRGHVNSCGCLRREIAAKTKTKHGHARRNKHTREYRIWCGMISRCTLPSNPSFPDYGGRGIKVCDRWLNSFENFIDDMGKCPPGRSIDRKNNDGNYEPGNCHWATPKQQSANRRKRRWKKHPLTER